MSDSDRMVVFLSGDLVFASRVRCVAEQAGWGFRFGSSLPEGELKNVGFVIVDLSTRSGVVPDIVAAVEARCPDAKLIAYGPHVQLERLNMARQAGIPTVLTRGQFDASLPTLLLESDRSRSCN